MIEVPSIHVSDKHRKMLYEEFKVGQQGVYNALTYRSNSPRAKAIRARAAELLDKEAKQAKEYVAMDFHN